MTRALVIGMGKSGLSLARHFARAGAPALVVDDRAKPPLLAEFESGFDRDSGIEWKIEDWKQWDESRFAGFRPIAASPGVSPTAVRAPREKITNDAALFFAARAREYPRSKLLAVTGTNGKSSLAALCEHLCRKCGRRAQAVGNIGYPFLDALADWARAGEAPQIVVAELSSFQLEIAGGGGGADCATILNLAPDHIDRHGGFAAYAAAKRLVYRGCGGVALNIDEADAADAPTDAAIENFSTAPDAPDDCWSARGGFVRRGEDKWISRAQLSPSLRANPQTAVAALAMLSLLDLPRVARAAICEGLADFPGLPHRLREVARRADGVSFIDDSKATNVAAAIFALRATPHASAMIVGGAGKGQDFFAVGGGDCGAAKSRRARGFRRRRGEDRIWRRRSRRMGRDSIAPIRWRRRRGGRVAPSAAAARFCCLRRARRPILLSISPRAESRFKRPPAKPRQRAEAGASGR